MRKMEVIRKRTTTDRGESITLVYTITVDELTGHDCAATLENYGVGIEIPERSESVCVREITPSAASIYMLSGLISENLVTPCTLFDVVNDWICGE